jgi:agmatine/peptidylarginine deiminase
MPPRGNGVFGGTYTNVVYANGLLFVPKFGSVDEAGHAKAVEVYQELLPDWKIISVESSAWLVLNGSIHCVTKNLYRFPARTSPRPRA